MKFLHEQIATWVPELSKMIQVNGINLCLIRQLIPENYSVKVKYCKCHSNWKFEVPSDEKTDVYSFPLFIFEKTVGTSVSTVGTVNCDDYVLFDNKNEYLSFLPEGHVKKMLLLLAAHH